MAGPALVGTELQNCRSINYKLCLQRETQESAATNTSAGGSIGCRAMCMWACSSKRVLLLRPACDKCCIRRPAHCCPPPPTKQRYTSACSREERQSTACKSATKLGDGATMRGSVQAPCHKKTFFTLRHFSTTNNEKNLCSVRVSLFVCL